MGSKSGFATAGSMFFVAFGIWDLSKRCTKPSWFIRLHIQSVTTWMSRPPELPLEYCGRTLPKNSLLSLMSSVYLTVVPYFFLKSLSVSLFAGLSPLSM